MKAAAGGSGDGGIWLIINDSSFCCNRKEKKFYSIDNCYQLLNRYTQLFDIVR